MRHCIPWINQSYPAAKAMHEQIGKDGMVRPNLNCRGEIQSIADIRQAISVYEFQISPRSSAVLNFVFHEFLLAARSPSAPIF